MLPLDLILEGGPELALELDLAWVRLVGNAPLTGCANIVIA